MSLEGEGGTPRLTTEFGAARGRSTVQNPLSSLDVPAADPEPPFPL